MRLQEVVVKMTLCRKRLITILRRAVVRLFASMQSQMRLQVSFLIEGFLTVLKWTDEVPRPVMLLQVHFQALLPTVRLITALYRTYKVLLLLMSLSMVSEVAF